MSDWNGGELAVFAPQVEVEASLALFERRRRRDRRHRRVALAAVVVLAVLLIGVGSLAYSRDEGGVADGDAARYEILRSSRRPWGDVEPYPPFVTTQAGTDNSSGVDWRDWIAIDVVTDESGCLDVDRPVAWDDAGEALVVRLGRDMTPAEHAASPSPCTNPIIVPGRGYRHLIAVARRDLPATFDVVVSAEPVRSTEERRVTVEVAILPTLANADPNRTIGAQVLHTRPAPPSRIGAIEVIDDEAALATRWGALGLGLPSSVVEVDFERRFVVLATTSTGSCEPVLSGVERDADQMTMRFVRGAPPSATGLDVERGPGCGARLKTHTMVVSVDREAVPPSFTLRLPGDEVLGIEAASLDVVLTAE